MSIAPLDRLISIASSPEAYKGAKRLSELADAPYVVLLGAPGMGKTVAFEQFASQAGTVCTTAFRFRRRHLSQADMVFIDALDEVSLDKALEIAESLEEHPTLRWRVSCRAQDWNDGGRLSQAFGEGMAAHDGAPVVAQLQPLSDEEASTVLAAFGYDMPSSLLAMLQVLRSTPFVRSPLGLKFLTNVQPERMPFLTRFELYESGARHFATEHNQLRAEARQASELPPDTILDLAGRVFLTLLLAGKHGILLSSKAEAVLLSRYDTGLEQAELGAVLNTTLFIKRGEEFLPFHRSIQEFLAGRYLARRVTGAIEGARLHIERVLALMVSNDGFPAESLKALYAWFTCHLTNEGSPHHAQRLVQRDPETLLLHGDPARLTVASRVTLLKEVGARDPYFRWTPDQWGPAQICTSGLITTEVLPLAMDLLESETSTHRLSMLLEALSAGSAWPSAAEPCWDVALRQSEVNWCREQAVAAWLHNSSASVSEIWGRIDSLCLQAGDQDGHQRSIAQLFCAIPAEQLSTDDVERVLACLQRISTALQAQYAPRERLSGSIYAIRDIAWHVAHPLWRALILVSPKRWRLQAGLGALEHQFASVLCIAALSAGDVTVLEFAQMLIATGLVTGADCSFKQAAVQWLAERSDAESVLQALIMILDEDVTASGSLGLGLRALGFSASEARIRMLLNAEAFNLKVGAIYAGRQIGTWALTAGEPTPAWLIPLLRSFSNATAEYALQCIVLHEQQELERQKHQHAGVDQWLREQIPVWQQHLSAVVAGEFDHALYWGAEIYSGSSPFEGEYRSGVQALEATFGAPLAQAIQDGLARGWSRGAQLGSGLNRGVVLAASASIHVARGHEISGESTARMLQVLGTTSSMRDVTLSTHLDTCCIEQLNRLFRDEPGDLHQLATRWDAEWTALLNKLADQPKASPLHAWAVQQALVHPEKLSGSLLDSVLRLAELNVAPSVLVPLLKHVLGGWSGEGSHTAGKASSQQANRLRWAYFAVCLELDSFSSDFGCALDAAEDSMIHQLIFNGYPHRGYWQVPASTAAISRVLLQFLFLRAPLREGLFDRMWPDTLRVLKAVSLSSEPNVEAVLVGLLMDAKDTRWEETLRHELEQYRRDLRAKNQSYCAPAALAKVLDGKGPVSAQDLRALVLLVLEDIAAELQPSAVNLWKLYWDNKKPKTENDCRDALASKLADHLKVFGSFELAPESASSGGTRADLLISHAPFTVPVEAKRTNHTHLWYGHSGQLQTYTQASSSEAQGIYVIFWFGDALAVTSSPTGAQPSSPDDLQAALTEALPAPLVATTSVFVLDVSDAAHAAKVRKNSELETAKAAKPRRAQKPKQPKEVVEPPQAG
ncbi:NACHT domain-containing protein [Pseudomonas sichuanensis]|uniref:NACHT domain-containing protein n=1 Tax=Pseudomonas sichuanensis TaxID=2213015 RepID=UPI00380131F8